MKSLVVRKMAAPHPLFPANAPDILCAEMSGIPEILCNVQDTTGIPHPNDGGFSQRSRDRDMRIKVILEARIIRQLVLV